MGSVKVSVKVVCAECGKKLESLAKIKVHRRSDPSFIMRNVFQDLYGSADYGPDDSITIQKGAVFDADDDPVILCSKGCVLKHVEKRLAKLKYDKDNFEGS